VSGNDDIGGLVGRVGNNGHVTNSYATGEILGTQNLSGLYIYRLEAGDFIKSKKMILVK